MKTRVKIKLQMQSIDYLLEVIAGAALVILIIIPAMYWPDLPDIIPKHFNALGEPDAYGPKEMIWTLPAVALALFIGLTILNGFPHIFNYPVKVTYENAERLYVLGTRTIRMVKMVMIILFSFINYRTVKISLGENTGLGNIILPFIMISMALIIAAMIYKMIKARDK